MAAVMQQGGGHNPHVLGQAAAGGGGGGEKPNRAPGGHGNGGDDPNNRRCPCGKHFGPHRACRICGGPHRGKCSQQCANRVCGRNPRHKAEDCRKKGGKRDHVSQVTHDLYAAAYEKRRQEDAAHAAAQRCNRGNRGGRGGRGGRGRGRGGQQALPDRTVPPTGGQNPPTGGQNPPQGGQGQGGAGNGNAQNPGAGPR